MKSFLFASVFAAIFSFGAVSKAQPACQLNFVKAKVCGSAEFLVPPTIGVNAPFVLWFFNATNARFTPANIQIDLWMPEHGHGSKPVKQFRLERSGIVFVDNVFFVMRGKWLIRVRLLDANDLVADSAEAALTL